MSFASANTLFPTNTSDERGASTSSVVARTPSADASTTAQGLAQSSSQPWGATPEKLAFLKSGSINHNAFETVFTAYPPPTPEVGSRGTNRFALIVGTGYEGPGGSGWLPVPGAASDVRYWIRSLPPRGYKCDYLWDGLEDPTGHPTRANILRLLCHIAQCAEPGDEIILVFSGHGDDSAYIPMECPVNHTHEAVYPKDLRAFFLRFLQPRVAVLVVWDTCNAVNPFEFPQRLDVRDDRVVSEPITEFSQNETNHSVVVMTASGGTSYEAGLSIGLEKVQYGPLCWAAFNFLFGHCRDPSRPGEILKQLIEHIRSTSKEASKGRKKEAIPQFLCSARGPDVPPEVLGMLNWLFTAYHPHLVAHPSH